MENVNLRFLLTSCLISDYAKPRPHPEVIKFMASANVAMTFPACLDLERGIASIAVTDPIKAAKLRDWLKRVLAKDEFFDGMTAEVAEILAAILDCKGLRNLWFPSPKANNLNFGASVTIAAMSIAYKTPIATLNRKAFGAINEYFMLPGVFNPADGGWTILSTDNSHELEKWPTLPRRPSNQK